MKNSNESPVYEGKRFSPRTAIRKNCRWCNGDENPANCPVTTCPAYPLRLSIAEPRADTALRTIRAQCLDCAGSAEEVRTCTAYKPFLDNPPCALWPHRFGKRHVTEEYREARRAQANKQRREPGQGSSFAPQGAAKG